MAANIWYLSLLITLWAYFVPSVKAIHCFECDSANNFTCTEFWDPTLVVTEKFLTDCSHVHDAKYCVKMNGIFDGTLGTKRFCSSKDWGSYCEYIQMEDPEGTHEWQA